MTLAPIDAAVPTLGILFAQALGNTSDRIAMVGGQTELTYGQLRARVAVLLSAFDELGLKPGDGVGLALSGMSLDFACLYIACQIAGLWTTELPPHLGAEVIVDRVRLTQAGLVIVDEGTDTGRLGQLAAALPNRLASTAPPGEEFPEIVDLAALTARLEPAPVVARPPGPYAGIMFTSGSTGKPKPVLIPSHGAGTHALMVMATLRYPTAPITVVPLTHQLILQFLLVPTLLLAGTVVTIARYSTKRIIAAAAEHRANTVFLTTTEIYELAQRDDTAGLSDHLELIFYGGEPMSATGLGAITEAFGQVFVGAYGQTETLTAAFLRPEDHDPARPELLSAAGRPLVGARIEIHDDAGRVPPGEPGEIMIASPGCMLGYLGMEEESRKTLSDGWVRTGDVGYLDTDGFVHVLDRAKFVFKSGDATVYPHVVEQALTRHPNIVRAAVVGIADPVLGQQICAAVTTHDGHAVELADVLALFENSTIPAPHRLAVVTSLPVTVASKVDRAGVQNLFV